jgi:hypothetical protein
LQQAPVVRSQLQLAASLLIVVACGGSPPGTTPGDPLPDAAPDASSPPPPPPSSIASVTALDAAGKTVTQVRQGGKLRLRVKGSLLGQTADAHLEGAATVALTVASRGDDEVELDGTVAHAVSLGAEDLVLDSGRGVLHAPHAITITAITIGGDDTGADGTTEAPIEIAAGLAVVQPGDDVVVQEGKYALPAGADLVLPEGVSMQGIGAERPTIACDHLRVGASAELTGLGLSFRAADGQLVGDHVHALTMRDVSMGRVPGDSSPIVTLSTHDGDARIVLENVGWVGKSSSITGASAAAPLHLDVSGFSNVQTDLALVNVAATITGMQVLNGEYPLSITNGSLVLRNAQLVAFRACLTIRGEPTVVDLGNTVWLQLTTSWNNPVYIDDARPSRAAADGMIVKAIGVQMGGQTLSGQIYTGPSLGSFFRIDGTNQRMEF